MKNGRISEKSYRKTGRAEKNRHLTYGVIGRARYFDENKGKYVSEAIEVAIGYDFERKMYVLSFSNFPIKKSLPDSRDLSATFWASQAGACETEALSAASFIVVHNILPVKSYAQRVRQILQFPGQRV